jgi:single-strand DNA-binding protein
MKNHVSLIGRVGADPEVQNFEKSTVARFSLATSKKWKDKNGETVEDTQWHRVEFWGPVAEKVIDPYVKKGDLLSVDGEIVYGSYENKEGATVYTTTIKGTNLVLLGGSEGKKDGSSNPNSGSSRRRQAEPSPGPDISSEENASDPFEGKKSEMNSGKPLF